ncbi:MAG: MBL fold metallo-hydrolase [Bacteroidota bacterium]
MSSRRKFLGSALAVLGAMPALIAQDRAHRRSWWEMVATEYPLEEPPFRPDPSMWDDTTITAAWLGHATVLINFFGMKIITDPVLLDRIGLNVAGLFTIGPRRLVRSPLAVEELPPLDLILLSHAHMDHLDTRTIGKFDRSVPVIMAKHTSDVIAEYDFGTIYELDWGQWTQIGDLRVEALEVRHFGWRYPWEEDRSRGNPNGRSYNAYLLSRRGHHIVFGGDTSFHDNFLSLRRRNIPIDLAMMPIGAYDPWIRNHANPEQSLAMAEQMKAASLLPIHWNTFVQSAEPRNEPLERLKVAAEDAGVPLALESIGQTWALKTLSAERVVPEPVDASSGTQ